MWIGVAVLVVLAYLALHFVLDFFVLVFFDEPECGMKFYLETHPPISDQQYLKLCGTDIDPEVALKVRWIFSEMSLVDESQIYPEARIVKDLGLE